MHWGLLVFGVTYVLISIGRLRVLGFDRPAAALLGAVACVVLGVLTPNEALAAIDGSTLLLLFAVMGMGAFLALDGFFDQAEWWLVSRVRTRAQLLGGVVWGAGILSALITNDAVCVLGAPLVVRLIRRLELPRAPFLLALATAANTGSVATLVGNPQNMLCGLLGELTYRDHLLLLGPVALLGLAVNHALLHVFFRSQLAGPLLEAGPTTAELPSGARPHGAMISLVVIFGTAAVYTLGGNLAWTATAGLVLLMLIHRRDTRDVWPRIDWALLLFFSGLFVVVAGLTESGVPQALFTRFPLASAGGEASTPSPLLASLRLSGVFLVGSNLVSNVPFILVVKDYMATLPNPKLAWELLAMASTFAGNLTLLGSAANIIVAEAAQDIGGLRFFEHLRVGLPLTLLTTLIGVLWIVLLGG